MYCVKKYFVFDCWIKKEVIIVVSVIKIVLDKSKYIFFDNCVLIWCK